MTFVTPRRWIILLVLLTTAESTALASGATGRSALGLTRRGSQVLATGFQTAGYGSRRAVRGFTITAGALWSSAQRTAFIGLDVLTRSVVRAARLGEHFTGGLCTRRTRGAGPTALSEARLRLQVGAVAILEAAGHIVIAVRVLAIAAYISRPTASSETIHGCQILAAIIIAETAGASCRRARRIRTGTPRLAGITATLDALNGRKVGAGTVICTAGNGRRTTGSVCAS